MAVGDKVLTRVLDLRGRHKLADRWSKDVFEVVEQPDQNTPVYVVESTNGVRKCLHRNLLLPVGPIRDAKPKEKPKPKPRVRKVKQTPVVNTQEEEEEDPVLVVTTPIERPNKMIPTENQVPVQDVEPDLSDIALPTSTPVTDRVTPVLN